MLLAIKQGLKPLKKEVIMEKITPFFKKPPKNTQSKKKVESDNEMLFRIAKKMGICFVIILMFDTLIDLSLSLSDVIFHLVHLGIEVLEYSIEIILEYFFHISTHQSEAITANFILLILLYAAYHLCLIFPTFCKRLKRTLHAIALKYLRCHKCKWRSATVPYKIKWICAHSIGISLLVLLM